MTGTARHCIRKLRAIQVVISVAQSVCINSWQAIIQDHDGIGNKSQSLIMLLGKIALGVQISQMHPKTFDGDSWTCNKLVVYPTNVDVIWRWTAQFMLCFCNCFGHFTSQADHLFPHNVTVIYVMHMCCAAWNCSCCGLPWAPETVTFARISQLCLDGMKW